MRKLLFLLALLWPLAAAAQGPNTTRTFPSITGTGGLVGLGAASSQYVNAVVTVQGLAAAGDGGGGLFTWSAASTATADHGTIFAATGVSTGRWLRQLPGYLTPQMFGAKCDGSTDDSTAFSYALTATGGGATAGSALFIPAAPLGCVIASNLSYTLSSAGPLRIYGTGPKSRLIFENSSGGLEVIGTCGLAIDKAFLSNFSIEGGGSGAEAYGIWLNGVAAYGVDTVSINSGSQTLTKGIYGSGAQQGRIVGGYDIGSGTGIYLNDCVQGGGAHVSSNGVYIGGGRTFNPATAAVDFEGGAAVNSVDGIQSYGGTHGIINDVTGSSGGYGPNIVYDSYFEAASGTDFEVTYGSLFAHDNSHFSSVAYHVTGNGTLVEHDSLVDGTGTFDSGASVLLHADVLNGALTNNAGCGTAYRSAGLLEYMNTGMGASATCPGIFAPSFVGAGSIPTPGSGQGAFGGTATNGAIVEGNGATCDAVIGNNSYNNICVPHGSPHVTIDAGLLNSSSAPGLTSCGASPSVSGTDTGGVVTFGTSSPTACTVTFNIAYPSSAWCTIAPANSAAGGITAYISAQSKTAFTITLSGGTNSVAYNYNCNGQ
jgi:hypothetical protein